MSILSDFRFSYREFDLVTDGQFQHNFARRIPFIYAGKLTSAVEPLSAISRTPIPIAVSGAEESDDSGPVSVFADPRVKSIQGVTTESAAGLNARRSDR